MKYQRVNESAKEKKAEDVQIVVKGTKIGILFQEPESKKDRDTRRAIDDLTYDFMNMRSGKASFSRMDSVYEMPHRFDQPDAPSEDVAKQTFEVKTQSEEPTRSTMIRLVLPKSQRGSQDIQLCVETPTNKKAERDLTQQSE